MSDWSGILWLFILLLVNAFFVAAEFAVMSARRSQIEPMASAGKRSAKTALWAMENATLMLATSQLGITVASLLILNVSEPSIHELLSAMLSGTGWSVALISGLSFVIALVLVTGLHVVLGELVPKNLSFSIPERAVLFLAPPLVLIARAVRPVIVAMNALAAGVLRMFRVTPRDEAVSTFTLEEVATIVSHSTQEGTIDDTSGALSAAFEFTTKKAIDIQVPVGQLVTLPVDAHVEELEKAVAKHGFSRYLIRAEDDTLLGYLHLKDVLAIEDEVNESGTHTGIIKSKRIRQLVTLAESTDLEDALAQLQRTGVHIARVVSAEGVTTGVLFLEDIIEELVGEVHDATRRNRPPA